MNKAIFDILEAVAREYSSIYSTAAEGALHEAGRRIRAHFDKELDGRVPAKNFVATLAANVDNDKMDALAFREFVRRTLPIVEGAPPSEVLPIVEIVERQLDAEISHAEAVERDNESGLADVTCALRAVKARLLERLK